MTENREMEGWVEEIFDTFDANWESFNKDKAFSQVSSLFISQLESGNEFYRNGAFKAALVHYDEAVKVFEGNFPINEKFWFKMGIVYRTVGKAILKEHSAEYHQPLGYRKAIECFQKSVELNPSFKEAWLVLAFSYDKLANFYHQKTLLKTELEAAKIDNYYQNSIACLRNELECLDRVIELDPNDKKAEFWRKSIDLRMTLFKELWQSRK